MSAAPEISVLLPVHNAAEFLSPALASLAAQKGPAFEVVAVNDGSTDASGEILQRAAQEHAWLRVITLESPGGVAHAINRAWRESRGSLIARMDADDIALPGRLKAQADFLHAHPAVGVCGSWFELIGERRGLVKVPVSDAEIRARLVFGSAFAHPAVMMRREVVGGSAPYDPAAEGFEDYDLWLRLAKRVQLHNLPQVLLQYRQHPAQITRSPRADPTARYQRRRTQLLRECGMDLSENEERINAALALVPSASAVTMPEVAAWLRRLDAELVGAGWCEPDAIHYECCEAWWRFARRCGGPSAAGNFWRSEFAGPLPRSAWRALRLALRRQVSHTISAPPA